MRKTPWWVWLLPLPVVWWAALAVACRWQLGTKITALLDALNSALAEPFALTWVSDSPRFLLVFTVVYAVAVIVAVTDQKNTRPGAEHGSAAWGDVFRLNKFYMDKRGPNLLLTQHFHIGIDGYKHITSGNAALVLQTLPQARAVLTAKDWDKFGRRVNKGAKGIPQLVRVNGYYNVGSIFDVSMTYGNKPYPIPEIKPEQMDKAIKELERLSPVNIIFQNEGVVGYDAEQHVIVFPTAMPQCEVLARLPAEIVIATAEQHTPGISQAPYLRKTAMAVSVEFCGRFSLPMPDTAAAVLDGMDTHIPPGEERKTLEEIRELSVTIGDTVEKALGLQRGQSAPQRDEAR